MRSIILLTGIFAGSLALAADPPLTVEGKRLTKPPTIDGVLGEGEWSEASALRGFVDPVTGQPPIENTDVWIGYDDKAMYIAFLCHDSDPSKIVARANQPNSQMNGEDNVAFFIDPFNRRSYEGVSRFQVSAKGTQAERIAGGRADKREWRGEWQAAAKTTEHGYIVEMRIPWKIINLPPSETRSMQVNFYRTHARTKVTSAWSNTGVQSLAEFDGIWTGVTPPKAEEARKLDILGYVAPEYDEDASPQSDIRAGVDFRYRFNPRLTGLLSVRPDFKNIEQQVEGINFTRTERQLEDSRPFFVEGGQYFALTGNSSIGKMFYTRRIGDFDVGGKFYGALNAKDSVAALVTKDGDDRYDSVLKYRRQLGPRSYANAYHTNTSIGGFKNSAIGSNGYLSRGDLALAYDVAASDFNGLRGNAHSAALAYTPPNWEAVVRYLDVSEDFRPPLALIPFRDWKGMFYYVSYSRNSRTGPFRNVGATAYYEDFNRHSGANGSEAATLSAYAVTRSNYSVGAGYEKQKFGSEEEQTYYVNFSGNVDNPYRTYSLYYNWGERGGEPTRYLSLYGQYRFANNIDVSLSTSVLNFMGQADQTVFGLGWEIDPSQSISARMVRTNGNTNWYMAYRKAGFSGLEWFVILGDPNAQEFRKRVVVKLVWAM